MASIFTDHMFMWLFLFIAGLTASSVFGVNPIFHSNSADEQVMVSLTNFKKKIVYLSLIIAIIGEYAIFIGAILLLTSGKIL